MTAISSASSSASSRYCVVNRMSSPRGADHGRSPRSHCDCEDPDQSVGSSREEHTRLGKQAGGGRQLSPHAARDVFAVLSAASASLKRSSSSTRGGGRPREQRTGARTSRGSRGPSVVDRGELTGQGGAAHARSTTRQRRRDRAARPVPASGSSSVARMRMSVVLPAPFGPRRRKTMPSGNSRSHRGERRRRPEPLDHAPTTHLRARLRRHPSVAADNEVTLRVTT